MRAAQPRPTKSDPRPRKLPLDKRLALLFWPLLLILLGAIGLFPDEQVRDGTLLVGIGRRSDDATGGRRWGAGVVHSPTDGAHAMTHDRA